MSITYANAPARGRGAVFSLGRQNDSTLTEKAVQTQVLMDRLGLSEAVASVVLGLLREEPWR